MIPLYQSTVFGISSSILTRYISRTAYLLWARLSCEVQIVPVIRCHQRNYGSSKSGRKMMDSLTVRVPRNLRIKVHRWVGPLDWVIRTPGVLPLIDTTTRHLDLAILGAIRRGRTPRVYGMDQEVFAEEWLKS
jgi:hypothetical protein